MSKKVILETERLLLTEFDPTDAEYMYLLNFDPEVLRYTGDKPFSTVEEARIFLRQYQAYKDYGFGRWSVWQKAEMTYVGWCGLKRNEEGLVDLGFRLLRSCWNQGFATEAAKACIDYGFSTLGMDQIIGRADQDNIASIRVLEKVGMQFWKLDSFAGVSNAVYYKIERQR